MAIRATQVFDVMTFDPRTIESTARVGDAYAIMVENGFRHVPVVDDARLVGVISLSDIGRLGATIPALLEMAVADAMTTNPLTITPEELIEAAAAQMGLNKLNCLPVVASGRLVGIITTYDLLDALVRRRTTRASVPPT